MTARNGNGVGLDKPAGSSTKLSINLETAKAVFAFAIEQAHRILRRFRESKEKTPKLLFVMLSPVM